MSALTKALYDATNSILEMEIRERALCAAIEDLIYRHNTPAHAKCPPHDSDDHGVSCCAVRRARSALLNHDLAADDLCRAMLPTPVAPSRRGGK